MNYEKKLALAKEAYDSGSYDKETIEYIFPELAESEDERIRKALIDLIKCKEEDGYMVINNFSTGSLLAWLEKQGEQKPYGQMEKCINCQFNYAGYCNGTCILKTNEQKPIDKVEPKFKVGDTMRTLQEADDGYTDGMPVIVSIDNEYYHCTNELIAIKDQDNYEFPPINVKQKIADNTEPKFNVGYWITNSIETVQITGYDIDYGYQVDYKGNLHHRDTDIIEKEYHLWSIQDAKDGDVLVDVYGNISIYEKCDDFDWMSYCSLGINGGFQNFKVEHENDKTHPSTKEQRELLFSKMREAGYEWNEEKKELKRKESKQINEDEEIRNALIRYHQSTIDIDGIQNEKIIAWLEKQGKPKLVESEDEKIRQNCIHFLELQKSHHAATFEIEECIAWLEKQASKNKTALDKVIEEEVNAWLEKQVPKQKWSEEDEQYLLICKNALRKYQVSDKWDADIISKWLEDKLKQGEQKSK